MSKSTSTKMADSGTKDKLNDDDIFKLADLYFKQERIMYSHQHCSFDKFLEDTIPNILENGNNSFMKKLIKII